MPGKFYRIKVNENPYKNKNSEEVATRCLPCYFSLVLEKV